MRNSASVNKTTHHDPATGHLADACNLLNVLFPVETTGAVQFYIGENYTSETGDLPALLIEADDKPVYVSPTTTAGEVAFLAHHLRGASDGEWATLNLPPSAVLTNGEDAVALYALWPLSDPTAATPLAAAMGVALNDLLPLPGEVWTFAHHDAKAFYTLDEVAAVFGAAPVEPHHDDADYATLLDARLLTPLDLDAAELQQEMVISVGANFQSKKWKNDRMPIAKLIAILAKHPEGKQKDGSGFVLAEIVGDHRRKQAVAKCYGVGLDIDVGMPGAEIDELLKQFGHLAIRYTTFSHAKTTSKLNRDKIVKWCDQEKIEFDGDAVIRFLREKTKWSEPILATAEYTGDEHEATGLMACISHAPMEKHRIVLPLAEPFEPATVAKTHAQGMAMWAEVCRALARRLGDLPMDNAATDPSRLFYFPRHAKDLPHETTIVGGPLFDWKTLDLTGEGVEEVEGDEFDKALAAEIKQNERASPKSKSKTDEGKKLGRWAIKAAHGFQIADVIRDHADDRIRTPGSSKIDIECPFDEEHSNPGDPEDRGCFAVNAGDGPSEIFTIHCAHDSCQGKTNLDFLGKMRKDGWFSEEVLRDDRYNVLAEADRSTDQADDFPLPGRHFGLFDWVTFDGRRFIGRKVKGEPDQPLCSPFAVIGAARYADRDGLRDVEIALENEAGEREVIRVPADMIPRRDALIAHLRGRGMTFADPKQGPALVHRVLMATQPEARTLYDRPGFLPDGSFLMPTGVVVGADPAKVGLSDRIRIAAPATAGDLDGWKAGAKVACEKESLSLKAGLFAGFAGPLLALAGRGTLVLTFTGTTTQGKTWRQQVGVAASGPPKPGVGQMRSLNSTQNALEAPLERGSSTITAFDETAFADASTVQRLTFLAAGEQGKARLTRDGSEGLSRSWRGGVVTLSTEVGLAQLLRQEGERQSGGMTVRMIEVDVERDGRLSDADFKIANGMLANYGHALPVFLAECRRAGFIDNPGRLTERAEALIKGLPGVAAAPAHRAALGLGFLGVAAEIAMDAALVPESLDVAAMIQALWTGTMASGVAPVDPVDRAIAQLVETINARRGTEVFDLLAQEERLNPRDPTREIGCWVDMHEGSRVYLVRDSVLGAWSGGAVDVRTLRTELKARDLLIPQPKDDHNASVWGYWRSPVGRSRVVALRASVVEGDG
jgi:hypothetical protein